MASQPTVDHQAALLAKKFEGSSARLKKHEEFVRWLPSPSKLVVITAVPYRLENILLPSLRHRLTALSMVLEPDGLSKDPSEKWQAALKLLAEVDCELEGIKNSVDSMLWNSEPFHERRNAVTSTRCECLRGVVGSLFGTLASLCNHYAAFVADCKGSSVSVEHSRRKGVLQSTAVAWRVIDDAIAWLRQSDFKVMQEGLQKAVELIEDALEELMQLIHSVSLERVGSNLSLGGRGGTESNVDEQVPNDGAPVQAGANEAPIEEQGPDPQQEEGGHNSSGAEGGLDDLIAVDYREEFSEEEILRAKLAVPLLKLVRLFVNKLSKPTNSGSKTCSRMTPGELVLLLKAVDDTSAHIDDLACALGNVPHNSVEITEAVTDLMSDSGKIVRQINMYFDRLELSPAAQTLLVIYTPSNPTTSSTPSAPYPPSPSDSLTQRNAARPAGDKHLFEAERKWCRVWGEQFHQAALSILDTCDHA